MYKTIYFFKLDIKKTFSHEFFSESEFYNIFDMRLKKEDIKLNIGDDVWGEYKTCKVDEKLVVDILEHSERYLFATLGCIKSENKLRRIRNMVNLSHKEIELGDNNILEDYTFLLLDYSTGIISVINSKGAPDIKKFKKILYYFSNMEPTIYAIKNNNVSKRLSQIKDVGGVEFKFALPPNKVLGNKGEGASMELINKFNNDGFESCEVRFNMIRGNKKRKNPKMIIDEMLETYNIVKEDNNKTYQLEKLGLIATSEDERQQSINLLELYFTRGVQIKMNEDFTEKNIQELLTLAYNELKQDILDNVKYHEKVR